MTINYILQNIFSENNIKWHCKDLDSIAMAEFNVACPLGMPFAEPIIDVKEVFARGKCLSLDKVYNDEWVKVICLINSCDSEDIGKVLTVRQILGRLQQFDGKLELCSADKDHDFNSCDWVSDFTTVHDEEDSPNCKNKNISQNYKGRITYFVI